MIPLLAFRNLLQRPWRSALLLLGFAMGVSVMIVLLSVGEALVAQARDRRLVGGGEITVLPEGLDLEMLKVGGLGGIYFSIPNARFVQLQLLDAPRLAADVRAVAPQIEGKLVYLRLPDGREMPVQAAGDVPGATTAVGAAPRIVAGAWRDDDGDRRWSRPTPAELRHDIDHFHLPPAGVARPESWAEWHYFNVLSPDGKRWAFVSLIVAGDVTHRASGLWGGQVLVTTHAQGETDGGRRYSAIAGPDAVRFSTTDADLTIGASSVRVLPDGRYAVHAEAPAERGGGRATVDLVVTPQPRAYFPGATLESGDFASGYAVAALRADASGTLCAAGACERLTSVQAYHDHNWGTWQGVTWEWGAGRAGDLTLLYGRVQPPDSLGTRSSLFLYVVDSLGFRALFRPRDIAYVDDRVVTVGGRTIRVPSRGIMLDARGADTIRVELDVEHASATDTRLGLVERGDADAARHLARPYFVQMKGRLRISGRVGGQIVGGEGAGFFETYR
ncbi:MacB-like periplasmic core domain protein [Gemmatirosa kalamazoonensis]|uniref:MacB-like periplasmic core domain protein n=1 Tax=Gemmatirosa kalamazoonensis TaxID=861299 RepID=W0RN23_9BACT|nr:ABC transporter permease [Gemmatirosa kalamazoonensis]AHG91892.1 MacB-like periplasmic core domain protein [Gemmatirosa kalamazoonensis]